MYHAECIAKIRSHRLHAIMKYQNKDPADLIFTILVQAIPSFLSKQRSCAKNKRHTHTHTHEPAYKYRHSMHSNTHMHRSMHHPNRYMREAGHAAATACSPEDTKELLVPGDPYLLPLLQRVGEALHSRDGSSLEFSALQRFEDSLLWNPPEVPEVRYGSCMSRFACVAWLEQG
jgi:hypothetical protein